MIAPDSRLLEGAVHPLDLSVRPRAVWLCEPMLENIDKDVLAFYPSELLEPVPERSKTSVSDLIGSTECFDRG